MFCDFCGSRLPEDSVFCPECGAKLTALSGGRPRLEPGENGVTVAPEPEKAPNVPPMPDDPANDHHPAPASPSSGQFTRTRTLAGAARLAIERDPAGGWCTWDSYGRFSISAQKLLRDCEKEDRYLASTSDGEGVQYYVVSPDGAIGQVYLDDNDEHLILEWMYFTRSCAPEELPSTPDEL